MLIAPIRLGPVPAFSALPLRLGTAGVRLGATARPARRLRLGFGAAILLHLALLAGLTAVATRPLPETPPERIVELQFSPPAAAPETPVVAPSEAAAAPEMPSETLPAPVPENTVPAPAPIPPPATSEPLPDLSPLPPAVMAKPEPPPPSPRPASRASQKPAPTRVPAPPRPATEVPAAPTSAPPASAPSAPAGVTIAPAALPGNAHPSYPPIAQRRAEQGDVGLRISIGTDGVPIAVDVVSSSGHPLLDEAAKAGVRGWRFTPARRGGVPVEGSVNETVRYRLEN